MRRALIALLFCFSTMAAAARTTAPQTVSLPSPLPNDPCFNSQSPANQFTVDVATGITYRCVANVWTRWDLPPCATNPPTGACTAQSVCKRSDAAEVWGCSGALTWTNMSGAGAGAAGATGDIQRNAGAGALGVVPGFTGDGTTGAVTMKVSNSVRDVASYATAGNGTSGSPWTSPSGTGGLQEAAATCPADGCELFLRSGYFSVTGTTTLASGHVIKGSGVNASIIQVGIGFSGGTEVLRWINPVSDNSFAGTIVKGAGGRDFTVDVNENALHGIRVFKGYDGVTFDTVSIIDVGPAHNAFRFEPNTAYAASLVSQTITLINTYAIHMAATATQPLYYFDTVQELTLLNTKGLHYSANPASGAIFFFRDCRGVNASGISLGGTTGTGIWIFASAARDSEGLYFFGTTIEAANTAVRIEGNGGGRYVKSVGFYGTRKQDAAITTGGFVLINTQKVHLDIVGFTLNVDAGSSDVTAHVGDIVDVTDAGSIRPHIVTNINTTYPNLTGKTFLEGLALVSPATGGPQIGFAAKGRTDYWRLFWSANSTPTDNGYQLRYVDTGGTGWLAADFDSNGDIAFYNHGAQAMSMVGTRVRPTIFTLPSGPLFSRPPTCSVGDQWMQTDAIPAGQQVHLCTATNTWTLQGDGGGPFKVNGTTVPTPNLYDNGDIAFSFVGSDIKGDYRSGTIVNSDVAGGAEIDLTKIASFTSETLRGRLQDETGIGGAVVYSNGPTINSPVIQGGYTPNTCLRVNSAGRFESASGDCPSGGGGSVNSVGIAPPAEMSAPNVVTSSGNITLQWNAAQLGRFLATPAGSGTPAIPSLRQIVNTDLEGAFYNGTPGSYGSVPSASQAQVDGVYYLAANGQWLPPPTGLATSGSPAQWQLGVFGSGSPPTTMTGVSALFTDANGNVTANSFTTPIGANGSRRLALFNNVSQHPTVATTYSAFYAYGTTAVNGDNAIPYFRSQTGGIQRILTDVGGDYGGFICAAGSCTLNPGQANSFLLDLGDNGVNESDTLGEIATTGDTNSIFTESSDNKLLINAGADWPKADAADDLVCSNCIGQTEIVDDYLLNTGDTGTGAYDFSGSLFEIPNGTATVAADCDSAGEAGRIFIDTDAATGQQVRVCEGTNGWQPLAGGTGNVAADAIWDVAGDLAVGTGPNAAARLAKGTDGFILKSGATTLEWTPSMNVTITTEAEGNIVYRSASGWVNQATAAGFATMIGSPSGANLASFFTSETGSGNPVFSADPVFTSSIQIPNGTAPTVDAAGEAAEDTTANQLVYGAGANVLDPIQQSCARIEKLAAADDNVDLFFADRGIKIQRVACWTRVNTTTPATVQFYGTGAAIGTAITCDENNLAPTWVDRSGEANGTLAAGARLHIDVTNTPNADATDAYLVCFTYRVTRQ